MGIFSLSHIDFDIEEIERLSRKVAQCSQDLKNLNTKSQDLMLQLKQKWNTPKGRAFFNEQKFSWSDDVDKYVDVLETLKEMLDYASSRYQTLADEAKRMNLK